MRKGAKDQVEERGGKTKCARTRVMEGGRARVNAREVDAMRNSEVVILIYSFMTMRMTNGKRRQNSARVIAAVDSVQLQVGELMIVVLYVESIHDEDAEREDVRSREEIKRKIGGNRSEERDERKRNDE